MINFEFLLRISIALTAGLLIGFEREVQDKNAGLKTNALVSLGAAVFVLASLHFQGDEYVDITRVLGQVVSGIGFIGAGVILHKGTKIEGLTTAATVWCSAGAGVLAGVGMYFEVIAVVLAILFVNILLAKVNDWINRKFNKKKKN
ncbi:MgtC/SapB family protein [Salegentibacter sp. F14]